MSKTPIDDKVKQVDQAIEEITSKVTEQIKSDLAAIQDTVDSLHNEREESINRRFVYFCLITNLVLVFYIFMVFPVIKTGNGALCWVLDKWNGIPGTGYITPGFIENSCNPKQPKPTEKSSPSKGEYQFPVSGKVIFSSPFLPCTDTTNCRNGSPHRGIDLAGDMGQPLLAVTDGTIILQHNGCPQNGSLESFCGGGFGNWFILRTDDGTDWIYAHTSGILAGNNQKVRKGEIIAKMGNSGRSTGVHLHLEKRKNGEYLDPASYFDLPPLWNGTGVSIP